MKKKKTSSFRQRRIDAAAQAPRTPLHPLDLALQVVCLQMPQWLRSGSTSLSSSYSFLPPPDRIIQLPHQLEIWAFPNTQKKRKNLREEKKDIRHFLVGPSHSVYGGDEMILIDTIQSPLKWSELLIRGWILPSLSVCLSVSAWARAWVYVSACVYIQIRFSSSSLKAPWDSWWFSPIPPDSMGFFAIFEKESKDIGLNSSATLGMLTLISDTWFT